MTWTTRRYREEFNDLDNWTVEAPGAGASATVAGGVLSIQPGVATNTEIRVTGKERLALGLPVTVGFGMKMSHKQANQETYFELVAIDRDGNVDETVVAGWRFANGDSATLTIGRAETRNGEAARFQTGNITGLASITADNVIEIQIETDESWFYSSTMDSATGRTSTQRVQRVSPDPMVELVPRIRIVNLGSAPAAAANHSVYFVTGLERDEQMTELVGGPGDSTPGRALSVNIAGGTPQVYVSASTSATGASLAKVASAASTNLTSVKTTSTRLYGYHFTNSGAAWRYVKLYNKASAPVLASDVPVAVIGIPPGGVAVVDRSAPMSFTTGLAYAITAGAADTDATVTAANEVVGYIDYI